MRSPATNLRRALALAALSTLLASCGGGGGDSAAASSGAPSSGGGGSDSSSNLPAGSIPVVNTALIPIAKPAATNRRIYSTGEMPSAAGDGVGAFRSVCEYSHMNFDDPLVYPGQPGRSHLHVFFGNGGVTGNSTPDSIRTSGSASCRGGIVNRTGYWVPAMIDTRTGAPIQPRDDIDIYYKFGYHLPLSLRGSVQPFPQGFRMIGGDSKSRTPQARMYYSCHSGSGETSTIPNCPGGELWQIVEFPQCWDGVNLDSPDHRSHVAYASGGRCPSGYPVILPEITYHVKYNVPPSGASSWRLSSDVDGAPAGSSGHGDWVNGWEQEVMNAFVARCVRAGMDCNSHMIGDGRVIDY